MFATLRSSSSVCVESEKLDPRSSLEMFWFLYLVLALVLLYVFFFKIDADLTLYLYDKLSPSLSKSTSEERLFAGLIKCPIDSELTGLIGVVW